MRSIAVSVLLLHMGTAQVFPFSNLRAFFETKNKQGRDGVGVSSSGNASRPHRQANHDGDALLPSLSEFDSPDIFTINRDVEDDGGTVKRHPDAPRRKNVAKHRINTQLNIRPPGDDLVFITPKPNQYTEHGSAEETRVRSKNRIRYRKPTVEEEPEVQQSQQVYSGERLGDSQPAGLQPSPTFTSEGAFVESIPSLSVAIEDDPRPKNNGLVDYLVPPKHPSVYEKALKLPKSRKPHIPKPKAPSPSPVKKASRFRPKKQHEAPVPPLSERAAKRHVRRRPPHRTPARTHPADAAATHMDEQITSETGFTGVGTGGSHGGERVEFQMHGQKGPNSYKFGYDTGKGHNRQFRFEEKDNHGRVKGHYGYYDKDGKLQVVNYEADPHLGFKAQSV